MHFSQILILILRGNTLLGFSFLSARPRFYIHTNYIHTWHIFIRTYRRFTATKSCWNKHSYLSAILILFFNLWSGLSVFKMHSSCGVNLELESASFFLFPTPPRTHLCSENFHMRCGGWCVTGCALVFIRASMGLLRKHNWADCGAGVPVIATEVPWLQLENIKIQ